jgi:UDP-N-acetylmuramate--alanine ligase
MVLPIYPAREEPIEGITADLVVDAARRQGHPKVLAGPEVDEAASELDSLIEKGDVLLTLGAGDVDTVGRSWLEVAS